MSLHLWTRNNSVEFNGTAYDRWDMETSHTSGQWFYYMLRQCVKPALLFRKCGLWDPLRLLSIEKLQKWTRRNPLSPCSNSLSYNKTHISSASVEIKESSICLEEQRHIKTVQNIWFLNFSEEQLINSLHHGHVPSPDNANVLSRLFLTDNAFYQGWLAA